MQGRGADGHVPRIVLHPHRGPAEPLTVRREEGALVIDLAGTPADDVERLVVDWPSESLRAATLIDTPGIASTSTATTSCRTTSTARTTARGFPI